MHGCVSAAQYVCSDQTCNIYTNSQRHEYYSYTEQFEDSCVYDAYDAWPCGRRLQR